MRANTAKWLACGAALTLAVFASAGARDRAWLVASKVTGQSGYTWREIAVRLCPSRWQLPASKTLGASGEDPPAAAGERSWIRALDFSTNTGGAQRRSHLLFRGRTPNARTFESHSSILHPGPPAHPPHEHLDEELIVPLSGEVDVIRTDSIDSTGHRVEKAGPGRMIYHAAWQPHTIRASGPTAATYLVFRWTGEPRWGKALASSIFDFRSALESARTAEDARRRSDLLDSPTSTLAMLHVHLSTAKPGFTGAPHTDKHDAALVLLRGEIEVMGTAMKAPAVSFHAAGEVHGVKVVGTEAAQYLAVEFTAED